LLALTKKRLETLLALVGHALVESPEASAVNTIVELRAAVLPRLMTASCSLTSEEASDRAAEGESVPGEDEAREPAA